MRYQIVRLTTKNYESYGDVAHTYRIGDSWCSLCSPGELSERGEQTWRWNNFGASENGLATMVVFLFIIISVAACGE